MKLGLVAMGSQAIVVFWGGSRLQFEGEGFDGGGEVGEVSEVGVGEVELAGKLMGEGVDEGIEGFGIGIKPGVCGGGFDQTLGFLLQEGLNFLGVGAIEFKGLDQVEEALIPLGNQVRGSLGLLPTQFQVALLLGLLQEGLNDRQGQAICGQVAEILALVFGFVAKGLQLAIEFGGRFGQGATFGLELQLGFLEMGFCNVQFFLEGFQTLYFGFQVGLVLGQPLGDRIELLAVFTTPLSFFK